MARSSQGSARSQSASTDPRLSGHIELLAAPSYRQLIDIEPLFRRLIPFLTIVFILVIAAIRAASTFDHRETALEDAREELTVMAAALTAETSLRSLSREIDAAPGDLASALAESLPRGSTRDNRRVLLADDTGHVRGVVPFDRSLIGQRLNDVIGDNQPMTTFGRRAGVMELTLSGEATLVTVHHLFQRDGMIALTQPVEDALVGWRSELSTNVSLFVITSAVLLLLVYAFFTQATRARGADEIYEGVRTRIDTALKRGRCGLFDWDVASGRMFWTASMFEVLGMEPRPGLMGFGEVAKLVHPDDGDLYELAASLLTEEKPVLDRTLRMRHAAGRWVWMRIRAEIVRDVDHERPHLIGVALDTTEQKLLAERSATADIRLRDAIETVSEAFVLWDSQNRLVMCNSKYQRMHNLPDQAVRPGTPYHVVMKATQAPAISRQTSLLSGAETAGERSYEAELGDGRWLQINERRTKDGGFVSVGTDISDLKHHEVELIDKEKRLKATVADLRSSRRTLETQAQQLVELAQKYSDEKNRAEEANRAKSEFLANISHELRTPLNAIIGFSELMNAKMFGPLGADKYEEYCRDIHHSGTYLLGVINDILDMSRIEAGQVDLTVEQVDLDTLVDEAMRIMTPTASAKKITLDASIADGMSIEVDRRAMKQILLNLMSNAVKFTNEHGRVMVKAWLEPKAIVVAVEDNGIGIPQRELDRLGQPFVQVENQFTKTYQGSGLGLAIARSLTELHKGHMAITSQVGHGTTVTVRLPRDIEATKRKAA